MARPAPRLGSARTGVIILAAAVGWTLVAAAASGGDAVPVVTMYLASAAAFIVGRVAVPQPRWIIPAAIVLGAAGLALAAPGAVYATHPHRVPLGYVNAQAAFYVQAAIAAVMLATMVRSAVAQAGAVGAAAAFAVVPFANHALGAAAVITASALAVALALRRAGAARAVGAAVAAAMIAALVGTAVVGAASSSGEPAAPRSVVRAVTERRIELWGDAVRLIVDNPIVGVGPGRFPIESPTARGDRDVLAAHQEFLQQGAEQGILGLVLLVAAFLWAIAAPMASGRADGGSVLGAVAIAALGIGSSFDYLLHFWPLPVTAAALAGVAARNGPQRVQP